MIQEKLDSDTSKELLMLLSYCDNNIISKIPDNIIQKLTSSTYIQYNKLNKSLHSSDIFCSLNDLVSSI